MRLQDLERIVAADPSNETAKVDLVKLKARLEGPEIYLEPLRTSTLWKTTSPGLQDLCIAEVAQRLHNAFEFRETRSWSCSILAKVIELRQQGSALQHGRRFRRRQNECRLATFRHRQTLMDFNLIPGESMLPPFLIGRWAVTRAAAGEDSDAPLDRALVGLDWQTAKGWLSQRGLRLPRPEEWTHACRGRARTRYFWGDEINNEYVWSKENCEGVLPSFGKHEDSASWNAFGLVDMIGNTWEWIDTPIDEGGFLDEARVDGSCSYMTDWGEPPHFPEAGAGSPDLGFRAVADLPGWLRFDPKRTLTIKIQRD